MVFFKNKKIYKLFVVKNTSDFWFQEFLVKVVLLKYVNLFNLICVMNYNEYTYFNNIYV